MCRRYENYKILLQEEKIRCLPTYQPNPLKLLPQEDTDKHLLAATTTTIPNLGCVAKNLVTLTTWYPRVGRRKSCLKICCQRGLKLFPGLGTGTTSKLCHHQSRVSTCPSASRIVRGPLLSSATTRVESALSPVQVGRDRGHF